MLTLDHGHVSVFPPSSSILYVRSQIRPTDCRNGRPLKQRRVIPARGPLLLVLRLSFSETSGQHFLMVLEVLRQIITSPNRVRIESQSPSGDADKRVDLFLVRLRSTLESWREQPSFRMLDAQAHNVIEAPFRLGAL